MTFDRFDALAMSAEGVSDAIVAVLGPRALDLSRPGVTLGGLLTAAPATFEGLAPGAVARAALENAAFAVRESLALVRSLPGVGSGSVALSGGMGESGVFAGILADVLGERVRVHRKAAAIGAALIATTPSLDLAARAAELAAYGETVEPGAGALEMGERYERWLRLREQLDAMAEGL